MTRGLYTSASGMLALQVALDSTANNLANISTVGYKRDRAVFHDFRNMLISRLYDRPDGRIPPGIPLGVPQVGELGTGTYVEDVVTAITAQGPLQSTERSLDVALQGSGFFVVETPQGERMTRAGQFIRNAQGELTTSDGKRVLGTGGPIRLDPRVPDSDIRISEDGGVYERQNLVDRFRIVSMPNGGVKEGYTLLRPNGAVNEAAVPETKVLQGYLEQSTVNGIRETVELIQIQRAYEAGQKAIEASDSCLGRLFENVAR